MIDEFIHWSKTYLLLSATCNENIVVDDWSLDEKSRSVTVIATLSIYNPPVMLQGMKNIVGLTCSVGDTVSWFTSSLKQDH